MSSYQYVDDGEDDNCQVAAKVGICQEGAQKGKDVTSPGPVSNLHNPQSSPARDQDHRLGIFGRVFKLPVYGELAGTCQ